MTASGERAHVKVDGRTLGPKRDGLHDGRNRLTKAGRKAREKALEAMRREYVHVDAVPTLAELAKRHGVPYGAACDAAQRRGWKIEREARCGRDLLGGPPFSASERDYSYARTAVAAWEEFQAVGYCEFHQRRDRGRRAAPAPEQLVAAPPVDVHAAVVDLAAYRAQRQA